MGEGKIWAEPGVASGRVGGCLRGALVRAHMRRMSVPATRTIALVSAVAAGAALGIAWIAQTWDELAPCALCLWERWPYRLIVLLGLVAAVLPRGAARALLWIVVLVAFADAALATVHVGVEQHFWPSPLPECAAPRFSSGSVADMLKSMPRQPAKPCDSPSFLIPGLPVSMAAMDLLYATTFAIALAGVLWRSGRHKT
jgi:disulfide bond formation protein DsbB